MYNKKEKGLGKIDVVLLILIFCALIVIYILLSSDTNIENIAQVNSILNLIPGNFIEANITKENPLPNVTLSNEILALNPASAPLVEEPQTTQTVSAQDYYYYNQLSDNEKGMYAVIIDNIQSFRNGTDTVQIATAKEDIDFNFQSCWDAFCLDRPDIFYIDTKKVSFVTQTRSSVLYGIRYQYFLQPQGQGNYYLDCWNTSDEVDEADMQVEAIANDVISKTYNYNSLYSKVKCIHDFIIDNCEYNKENDVNNSDIYGNLVKKKSVCEGYAKAFKYLLNKIGIPCVIVCGNGIADDGHSEFHAWNYVQMDDGKWYAVDTTWDDPIIIGNGTLPEKLKYKYFLVGSSSFSDSHQEDGDVSGTGQNFQYPVLSGSNYR